MTWRKFLRILLLPVALVPALLQAGQSNPDSIGAAMAGEFAFQSGRYVEAARHYLVAAQTSDDLELVERATRLAALSGDQALLAQALQRWQQLAPANATRAGLALRLALRQNQPAVAAVEAELLLQQGADSLKILRDSLTEARGSAANSARGMLREVIVRDQLPGNLQAWLAVAELSGQLGENDSARKLFERIAGKFPAEPQAVLALARWQRGQGDVEAALATLARLTPDHVAGDSDRRQVAAEYLQLRLYSQADRWLAMLAPDAALYRQRLALLDREKNGTATIALVAQMRADAGLSAAQRNLLLGLAAELTPDWPAAERQYRDVKKGPEQTEAQLRLAFVLQKQGRISDAQHLFRKLQRDQAINSAARRDAYALEALLLAGAGKDADVDAYSRGLVEFEDDSKLLYGRAMRYVESGRVDAGLADLRRILDHEPDQAAALNAYGYTLAAYKQEYSLGLPPVEQALRLQPDSPAILDSLGFIRFKLGQQAEALPLLQRAWELQPDPEVAAHLGELLWLMGRRDEAGNVWREGLVLEPQNPQIGRLQEQYRP